VLESRCSDHRVVPLHWRSDQALRRAGLRCSSVTSCRYFPSSRLAGRAQQCRRRVTVRGSVVALDAATGDEIWKTYVIPETPGPAGTNAAGDQRCGPAGAAIWSAPTVDTGRGVLYVATGNASTQPAAGTSDAIMAIELATGAIRWWNQLTPNDAFITGCRGTNPNCPEDGGPDHDFGASPALVIGSRPGNVLLAFGVN